MPNNQTGVEILTKEQIKNLSVEELAEKLYVEFGKFRAPLMRGVETDEYISEEAKKYHTDLANNADQVQYGFIDYLYDDPPENLTPAKDPEANFKKAMKAAVDFLERTVPSGHSLMHYAEDKKITSPEFRYLLYRGMDITGVAPKGRSDDEIAGYDLDETAERVSRIHYDIVQTLRMKRIELPEDATGVREAFFSYGLGEKTREESLKEAMGSWDAFMNAKLPDGQTIAEYAEENNLLGYGDDKLVRRAKELVGIKIKEQEKQEPEQEQFVNSKKFFAEVAKNDLINLGMRAVDLVHDGNNEAARKEFNHYLSRVVALNNEHKQWGDEINLYNEQMTEIEEAIKIQGKEIEESADFQATVNRMSGKELYKMVVEKDPLGPEKTKTPDKIAAAYTREANQKTAAKWIEAFKKDFRSNPEQFRQQPGYPMEQIARIMAARELSKSVRGKASTLGEKLYGDEIEKHAAEIMENKSFKDFAAKLSKGENLSKVEAVFTKKFSHGGELDDMFRDYLTKRPAGELENDPKLKRWMPTVKQRVEFLQSEAAKVQKENKTPYKEAAEILLLRQAAEVKRGGKGLEANVPVIGEKGVTSLQASVKNYTDDPKFKAAFDQPDVKKYILSGHGGEMAERYNKQPEAKKIEQKNEQEVGK